MTHALIIGGGIAGAVTAMGLRRAGIDATVYEAYPTGADDVGAFLIVFDNGMAALRTIGAHQPVLDASFETETVRLVGHDGRELGSRASSGRTGAGPGAGPRTLRRATLYRVLHDEAARRGVTVEHGKRLIRAEFSGATSGGHTGATSGEPSQHGPVTAYFADGSRAHGDLLIGADGLHSVTRTLIDPDAPRPRHTGQLTVCGYVRGAGLDPDLGPGVAPPPGTYTMVRGKHAVLGCTRAPDGDVWWFANTPGTEHSRRQLAAVPPARWREHVAGLLADDGGSPAVALVRATGEDIVASNAYDIASTPAWHRGPMVVVGDAAHAAAPNAAQGASMAIEDSVVLAKCLRDLPDVEGAFTAYERLRRERVEAIVAHSAAMNDRAIGSTSAPARSPEARSTEAAGGERSRQDGAAWQLDYRIDWDEAVPLDRPLD